MKYSINQTKAALAELQTTLHWAMTMIKAPAAVGAMPENVVIRCSSSGVPEVQSQANQVELQGHTINYVGKTTKAGQITLTFVEGIDAAVTNYFLSLEQAKWSGDGSDTYGVQKLTNDLKFDIRLELMSPDDKVTQTYDLIGCMIEWTHGMNLSQNADPVNPTVNLSYDDFHVKTNGVTW